MASVSGSEQAAQLGWLEVAISGPVVRRALVYLVVVGSLLVAINHGDALLAGEVDGNRIFKMFLTPLVPYLVSTMSSVSAIRAQAAASQADAAPAEIAAD